jgi:Ethylbenzene dehydrogenase
MKLFQKKSVWIMTSFILFIGYWVSCTKNDQVLQQGTTTSNGTTLVSLKVTSAPTIDGVIDPMWDNATKLNVVPQVPDPGNGLFAGYIGETYPATLRSMYDNQYIYFLVEWADADKSVFVSTWYFSPAGNTAGKTGWAQEPSSKSFDANGVLIRDGFGEDKLAMLWNVDNSTPKFITQTCYASCHVFTPYLDYSVTPAVLKSNANGGNHYTNGANEKIDMWWAHLSKDLVYNQMDDNYQDWAGGPGVTNLTGGSGNGRHVDGIVVSGASATWPFAPTYTTTPAQGSSNNRVSLKLDGTGATVTVPAWIIPNATNYYYIKATDTLAGGTARKITGVSSSGVLTYSGGTIDPTVGTDYLQVAGVYAGDGPKCIPSYIASPLINERADITCSAVYTGTGWIVEYKRLLKTADVLKQDIDFSSLQDQPFGMAIWNKSNNQHGIKPNLLLKFQK